MVKMVKTIGACMGLLSIEITSEEDDAPLITKEQNAETRTFLMEKWMFGPEKTKANNSEYWRDISVYWRTSPDQAKRNLCANCEYFNDSPDMLAKMEVVPEDKYDRDGGGRGWCSKWDFICHNLRTCKAWKEAEQEMEEGSDYSNGEDDGNNESEAD